MADCDLAMQLQLEWQFLWLIVTWLCSYSGSYNWMGKSLLEGIPELFMS